MKPFSYEVSEDFDHVLDEKGKIGRASCRERV